MSLLSVEGVHALYNHAIVVLKGVTLRVGQGEIVALLGTNGAGKSTMLRAVANLLPAQRGQVSRGRIVFDGIDITHADPDRIVGLGAASVLEGRHCFRSLSVEENLLSGAAARGSSRAETRADLERTYAIMPRLKERRRLAAGFLSGGEQQMTAIGRALMARPRLLVLDEPSMGLAPRLVQEVFGLLTRLNEAHGLTVLVAEQNAAVALRHAHRGYVLENGTVALEDSAARLRQRDDIRHFYLGSSADAPAIAGLAEAGLHQLEQKA
jgi:branched-chain amino acid transport system ATP-binding protein